MIQDYGDGIGEIVHFLPWQLVRPSNISTKIRISIRLAGHPGNLSLFPLCAVRIGVRA